VYTGQCPVLQRDAAQKLASLGISRRLLRYNSPDCPVHPWSNGYFAPTATCNALNARAARAEGRRAHTGAPDTEQFMSGAPPDIQAGPEDRAPTVDPNGLLVTWLSHRTCPVCTGLSGAPSNRQSHQTASLVVGAINTPNHPPFMVSKFSTSQLLTRALAFNSKHTKEIKSSPNSTQRPSD
jgi:hypothetical protein